MTQEQETAGEVTSGSRKWGCGCTGLFLVLVLVVGGGSAAYVLLLDQVQHYTAEVPAKLPAVDLTTEEMRQLQTKLEAFKQKVEKVEEDGPTDATDDDASTEDLILTADEINAVINNDKMLRGKAFVKIENGKISGEVSVPADALPGGEGRFLNAQATFDLQLIDGELVVILSDVEVKGEKVSDQIAETFSGELVKALHKNPTNAAMIRRLQSVTVKDDRIILRLRRAIEAAPAT